MKNIEYLGTRFFDLVMMQSREHNFSSATLIAKAIVMFDMKNSASKELHRKYLKKIDFILENTSKRLMIPLAEAEAIIASKEKNEWGAEFGRKNNLERKPERRDGKPMTYIDVYSELKSAMSDVIFAVVDIVKEYSTDYKSSIISEWWEKG